MAEHRLKRITIEGFKSIRMLKDFEMRPINVLIGANGSGKSNFLSVFPFLRAEIRNYLDSYVEQNGGADKFLFQGPKVTNKLVIRFEIGRHSYGVELPVLNSAQSFSRRGASRASINLPGKSDIEIVGSTRADLYSEKNIDERDDFFTRRIISNWVPYHFHDTSPLSLLKRDQNVRHDRVLESDASNIAAFLHGIRGRDAAAYKRIVATVQLVAPFIDDFLLEPRRMGEDEMVRLEWLQRGSDYPFQPYQLSDGTLRFICLATALMQPDPPPIIIIDEPELGLHPQALNLFAGLVRQASVDSQVIVSTQSPALVSEFAPEDVVVAQRVDGASTFTRLDGERLAGWLEDYSLGELWEKNVIEGGPALA